ncbi:MAG: hypothetical protein PUH57_04405 [Prevotellaceae bacterium]|nr:hypothetical protein [Prevotellaceae bacterium]MDY2749075.1 hypothetical protein [Prevotella sp.]
MSTLQLLPPLPRLRTGWILGLIILLFASCRGDEAVISMEDSTINTDEPQKGSARGMYLLCEGNMGSNKATIDYLDLSSADGLVHYQRNIFASRNPSAVKELGDVGNDIQIYGSKLWIVLNCSNKVEVCSADSCKRIGQVNIPNCRYVAFDGDYAYVSSYAGPVQLGNSQLGRVYKVDTLTLQKVDSVTVGRQPEEMVIMGGKLYVANSGGYTPENYDRTVSVVSLATMTEERKIDVAPNLHRLRQDHLGQLWVTSRGDYDGVGAELYYLSTDADGKMQLRGKVPVAVSEMCIVGDTLYYIGASYRNATQSNTISMGLVNVSTHQPMSTSLFSSAEAKSVQLPYGIIVNPETRYFYLMDAKNYVSSGELLCFRPDGSFAWRQSTGDIPSRAVFCGFSTITDTPPTPPTPLTSAWIAAVDEYVPAPGQFVNTLPLYEAGDDATTMARKCTGQIGGETMGTVSLGGFGGYITFHFDHPVRNVPGEYDLMIYGNAHSGGSEPGIVMVAHDDNNNGIPDDEWYELSGSADIDSIGKVTYGYEVTYTYRPMSSIPWTDNRGGSGVINRNTFHAQEYFPLWLAPTDDATLTLRGTLLPSNATDKSGNGTLWVLNALRHGYVDNLPNTDTEGCSFDISTAVHPLTRQSVALPAITFVRVYSAMNQQCGWIGETSTEITAAKDLHW